MITTWSEKIEARGLARGRAEGLAKGEAQGLAKGRAEGAATGRSEGQLELATRLLTQRFGTLPDSVRRKLAAIESTDELATLVERVFQGDSLEELGLA